MVIFRSKENLDLVVIPDTEPYSIHWEYRQAIQYAGKEYDGGDMVIETSSVRYIFQDIIEVIGFMSNVQDYIAERCNDSVIYVDLDSFDNDFQGYVGKLKIEHI